MESDRESSESRALVLAESGPLTGVAGHAGIVVPRVIAEAGDKAARRFLEFFAAPATRLHLMRSSGLRSEKAEKTSEIESARLGDSPRFFKLLMENHRSRANDIAERESIMQPHDFLTVSGTVVAVAVVTSSQALAELSVEPMHPTRFKAVQEAAGHCVETGKDCLRHCFGMLSMGDSSMAGCTAAAYQLIAACSALQSLAAVNSAHAAHFGRVVTKICLDCEKECKKFTDIAECVACSDACKACAEECHKAWIYVLRTP